MFPWSVIPIAGICNRCASASIGVIFAAPSNIEYSVWLCRCTKDEFIGRSVYGGPPTLLGVSRCVSLPRRKTLLTAGIGRSSKPSWATTPAMTNAATRPANQMPFMVRTLLLLSPEGIGCFPINIWPLLQEADLQKHDQPVNPGQAGTRSSPATATGTGVVMVSGGPVDR